MQYLSTYIYNKLAPVYEESEIKSLFQQIVGFVCKMKPYEVLLHKDTEISPNERQKIEDIVLRLRNHEPIQYILGETEFFGLRFTVNQNVLIPRPETEELVEWIVDTFNPHPAPCTTTRPPCAVLDIGTGSGCIAISIAKYLPFAQVYAIDNSEKALETAKYNALINKVNVQFFHQDIFESFSSGIFPEKWDLIVGNPPYIPFSEQKSMPRNVLDYEPHTALFVPNQNPLSFYERIADLGKSYLTENGEIYVETSAVYGRSTKELFRSKGYRYVVLRKDISGKDRMIRVNNRPTV